jgi:superfamily II DNA or RNA helicase
VHGVAGASPASVIYPANARIPMHKFEDIKPGARLLGLDPAGIAEVVQIARFGPDALNLVFRVDGRVGERLVYRGEENSFEFVETGRSYAFDADGSLLRLASEAYRIRLAYLFDPYLAVSASQIEALPHQITAVYGEMLPRQPLRFLLADDPGAGKTIMAGLLIKELLIRGDLERCLIVVPGGLVEQWQEEMSEKFGLGFDILTRDQIEASITGNPFVEKNRLILRLDMAARSDELKAKLQAASDWDLVICDEAHRMAASYFGGEVKETQRHKLGKLLGTRTRNFLLMSATPHNGKEADFQLFMGLLDADRFEGRFREGVHKADVSDMMRRLTKEELYRFDGTPLFPERCAYTASYSLSPAETDLYQAVTTYVRDEMNRADRTGDDKRRMNVGFALQILQRRLASSPAAIHRSLERRRKRLEERLREEKLMRQSGPAPLAKTPELPTYDPDDIDEVPSAEAEAAEEQILDQATAAQTLAELTAEIAILTDLEGRALHLKLSGQDAKWRQLESILDEPIMLDSATGLRRKILIFTEPKDTLEYLQQKITARIGDPAAVVVVHGGIAREARRAAIAAFNSDPVVRVMIANDAAGEGVNLQRGAHLMVNYDLPWNPNRIEQRFGRIHRIGQTEVCHLWNLCAANTREGEVYRRLLEKLEEARSALGGKVYDVLGELFEGHALRDLLVDAIRYGDRPEKKAELFRKVDGAVDVGAIEKLVAERKLTSEGMDPHAVSAIREQMERAQARRLQPHFIGAFFREASLPRYCTKLPMLCAPRIGYHAMSCEVARSGVAAFYHRADLTRSVSPPNGVGRTCAVRCSEIFVACSRATTTINIARSSLSLVLRAFLGAAKSCAPVIFFKIFPPTPTRRCSNSTLGSRPSHGQGASSVGDSPLGNLLGVGGCATLRSAYRPTETRRRLNVADIGKQPTTLERADRPNGTSLQCGLPRSPPAQ